MPAANGTTLGDGLNTGSYSFSSPNPVDHNTTIGRIDYVPIRQPSHLRPRQSAEGHNRLTRSSFPARARPTSSRTTARASPPAIPGPSQLEPRQRRSLRLSSARATAIAASARATMSTSASSPTPTAETRTTIVSVPVNNIVDNLSWTKGKHTLQFGGNWRLIHQNHSSDANSYNSATTNPYWLGGNPPEPDAIIGLSRSTAASPIPTRSPTPTWSGTVPSHHRCLQLQAHQRHSGNAAGRTAPPSIATSRPTSTSGTSRMPGASSPTSPSPSAFATPSCRLPGKPTARR